MSSLLEIAKEIIKENFEAGDCGLYNCRNIAGDEMETLYSDHVLTIDICYGWAYFEVFGLSDEEFKELKSFYNNIKLGQGCIGCEYTSWCPDVFTEVSHHCGLYKEE